MELQTAALGNGGRAVRFKEFHVAFAFPIHPEIGAAVGGAERIGGQGIGALDHDALFIAEEVIRIRNHGYHIYAAFVIDIIKVALGIDEGRHITVAVHTGTQDRSTTNLNGTGVEIGAVRGIRAVQRIVDAAARRCAEFNGESFAAAMQAAHNGYACFLGARAVTGTTVVSAGSCLCKEIEAVFTGSTSVGNAAVLLGQIECIQHVAAGIRQGHGIAAGCIQRKTGIRIAVQAGFAGTGEVNALIFAGLNRSSLGKLPLAGLIGAVGEAVVAQMTAWLEPL